VPKAISSGTIKNFYQYSEIIIKQAGAELGQAQVKFEVIVKVGVEDRCIYLILRGF